MITVPKIRAMHAQGEKIVVLTAYDYTFARLVDQSEVHITLVGDSLGCVVQGNHNTLSVTLDEMIYHAKMVVKGTKDALVVGDLPFLSYQCSVEDAIRSSGLMMKQAGVSAVKLEGGERIAESIRQVVDAGIPVMGHVGLTPQSYHQMGGHKVQGRDRPQAEKIIQDAIAVEQAGAFSIVLEGIPADLAAEITDRLNIPTIGIGAGAACSGQVLVIHDVLGLSDFAEGKTPRFIKQYANLSEEIVKAINQFSSEVQAGEFPTEKHSFSSKKPKLVKTSNN